MNFGMIMKNQNIVKKQIVLYEYRQFHSIQKNMIFIKKLQKMLKLDLILQIMNQIGRYQKEKKKSTWINER